MIEIKRKGDEQSNIPALVGFFGQDARSLIFQEGLKPAFLFATLTHKPSEQGAADPPLTAE